MVSSSHIWLQLILFLIANISFNFSVDHSLSGIIISTLFLIFPNSMSIIICTSIPVLDLTPWHVQNLLLPLNSHPCLLRTVVPFDLPCMKSGVSPSYLKYVIFLTLAFKLSPFSFGVFPKIGVAETEYGVLSFHSLPSFLPSFVLYLTQHLLIAYYKPDTVLCPHLHQ